MTITLNLTPFLCALVAYAAVYGLVYLVAPFLIRLRIEGPRP